MELQLTLLILLPIGLVAAAIYAFILRPSWARAIERLETLDKMDAEERRLREEAERELHLGDTPQ